MNSINNLSKLPGMFERLKLRLFSPRTKTDAAIKNAWEQFKSKQNNGAPLAKEIVAKALKMNRGKDLEKNIKIIAACVFPFYVSDKLKEQLSTEIAKKLDQNSLKQHEKEETTLLSQVGATKEDQDSKTMELTSQRDAAAEALKNAKVQTNKSPLTRVSGQIISATPLYENFNAVIEGLLAKIDEAQGRLCDLDSWYNRGGDERTKYDERIADCEAAIESYQKECPEYGALEGCERALGNHNTELNQLQICRNMIQTLKARLAPSA